MTSVDLDADRAITQKLVDGLIAELLAALRLAGDLVAGVDKGLVLARAIHRHVAFGEYDTGDVALARSDARAYSDVGAIPLAMGAASERARRLAERLSRVKAIAVALSTEIAITIADSDSDASEEAP